MKEHTSTLTIHMVSSLDGFIAKSDGSLSWMESKDHYFKGIELSEQEITEFLRSIDCYVMGANTYQQALELGWPYGDTFVYVLSSKNISSEKSSVNFYSGALDILINNKLKAEFKNIWMVGGSKLTREIIRMDLADKIVISIMPIILGDGLPFFDSIGKDILLHLEDTIAYKDGMVELCYKIKK